MRAGWPVWESATIGYGQVGYSFGIQLPDSVEVRRLGGVVYLDGDVQLYSGQSLGGSRSRTAAADGCYPSWPYTRNYALEP